MYCARMIRQRIWYKTWKVRYIISLMTFIKEISKVETLKHDRWWDHGSGGGVVSKNLEMSENEKKWSVIGKVSGFRVSKII